MTWEYQTLNLVLTDKWSQKRQAQELAAFQDKLNAWGAQGWELITYQPVPLTGAFSNNIHNYAYLAIFKRRTS